MRAIVQERYGSTDALELRDIDRPVAGDDEVLVRVHAAGVDQGAWHVMAGRPYLVRVMGYGLRAPKVRVRGTEFAGRVETTGANVARFRPGDEVFGTCDGSFAEYASARVDRLAPKPANLSFEQAAAIPVCGRSAPTGSSTTRARTSPTARDVILDTGGNRPLSQLRRALDHGGTLVIVGAEVGGRWLGGFDRQLRALALSPLVSQRLRMLISAERGEDLEFLRGQVEAGTVTPVVDRSYPLSEAPDAIRALREGRVRGKLVLTV